MTALITGAAGGIGSAVANAFEDSGERVVRHDLRAPEAPDGTYLTGNLLDDDVLTSIERHVNDEGVTTVVAAHGVAGAQAISSISAEYARFVMSANTVSVLRLYDAVAPALAQRSGVFVAVASQAGLVGEANNGVYCASKFALVGWAKALDRAPFESRPRVRLLCPGATQTPLLVDAFRGMADSAGVQYEDVLASRLAQIPAGRLGRTEDLGAAAVWLAALPTRRSVIAAVTGGEVLA